MKNALMLGTRDDYAAYTTASDADRDRYGFLTANVVLPERGAPPLPLVESFGTANPRSKPMKKGDFHTAFADVVLFSERAVRAFGETLTGTGNLYPVEIAGREEAFWWYWCTNVVDCLDEENSRRGPPSSIPLERRIVLNPVFREDRIAGQAIFRLPGQLRPQVFVTGAFRETIATHGLKGFKLSKTYFDGKPWMSA